MIPNSLPPVLLEASTPAISLAGWLNHMTENKCYVFCQRNAELKAARVRADHWGPLPAAQQERLPPPCPDSVMELASPSGSLADLATKLLEYIANDDGLTYRSQNRNCPRASHRQLGERSYVI